MDVVLEGGCGCGHVRYRAQGMPIIVNNCHCRQCQQQTGSTSVVNAFYEAEAVKLLCGALVENTVRSGSGGAHTICRCAQCGVALWSFYPRLGRLGLGLRVTTLDTPEIMRPDAVIYVSEAMPWAALPADIPQFATNSNPAEVLPPDRLARLMGMAARRKAGEG